MRSIHFEWDAQKRDRNLEKHGVTFEAAITVFDDPYALISPDEAHSTEIEAREWIIGEAEVGVLVVVFTFRAANQAVRLISARRASRKERKHYEEAKRIPF